MLAIKPLLVGGLPSVPPPAEKEKAAEVQAALEALARGGARALLAPTQGANRALLADEELKEGVAGLNQRLVALAKRAAAPAGLPVGGVLAPLNLLSLPFGEENFEGVSALYYEQALALEQAEVDFFLLAGMTALSEARAALLAVREVSEKPVLCTFACDGEGKSPTGAAAAAALVTLQSMGLSAFGVRCTDGAEALPGLLEGLRPYAKLPLAAEAVSPVREFVKIAPALARLGASVYSGGTPDEIAALQSALSGAEFPGPAGDDFLVAANERGVFHLSRNVDIGEEIEVTPDFPADVLEAEDDRGILHVRLADEEELAAFEEEQHLLGDALCISCDDVLLFEKALRVYHGRAVYGGEPELDGETLARLCARYGLVPL